MRKTLVFVHGYLGGSAQWKSQVAYFGTEYTVICIDLPGFGLKSHAVAPCSINQFAEGVLAELSAQSVDTFDLVGHSMGGMIVQEMARIAPLRVNKLVLYSTGAIGALPGRFESIAVSKDKIIQHGVAQAGKATAATWFVEGENARQYAVCSDLVQDVSKQAALAALAAMSSWSGIENLTAIQSPTLIIWGNRDLTYRWPQIEKMWQAIPNAALTVVPNCAHAVHLEKETFFNSLLSAFLLNG